MSHLAPGGRSSANRTSASRGARVVGVCVLALLTAGIFGIRHCDSGAPQASALREGATALWRALGGDVAAYDTAERAFAKASQAVVVDVFPTYALEVTRRLRDSRPDVLEPALMPTIAQLKQQNMTGARHALAAATDSPAYALTNRLLNALDDARVAAQDAPKH